ncbi:Tfp pilus assembly protein FimT/FimU [Chamaesiphon sp.]|uniref:pilus assembly FimT family protein n=1 Tax=Chamaesiphon sp. TaxID=2814140 RepID=UPI003592ED34
MAIRPPNYNDRGFTLIEMLVTIAVAGILMGIAIPSLMSLNKPLRDGSLQFKNQLSLIRSKAISSNKAYRLRPKFSTLAEYPDGKARNFVVEYAGNCRVPENTAAPPAPRWQVASELDLDLPQNVGIPTISTTLPIIGTIANPFGEWTGKSICFDSRGILDDTVPLPKIIIKDFRGDNKAKVSSFDITKTGNVDINTYTESTLSIFTLIPINSQGNPEF